MPDKTAIRQAAAFAAVIAMRIILGGYFIISALVKIKDPKAFAFAIRDYQIIGDPWTTMAALGLPWIELFAGVGVVVRRLYAGSLVVISGMLVVFIIALASLVARNMDIECGCGVRDATPMQAIIEDFIFLAIAIALGVIEYVSSRRKTLSR